MKQGGLVVEELGHRTARKSLPDDMFALIGNVCNPGYEAGIFDSREGCESKAHNAPVALPARVAQPIKVILKHHRIERRRVGWLHTEEAKAWAKEVTGIGAHRALAHESPVD